MIDPGAIPQVGGDLEAVTAAGGRLKSQGRAVSDTGADVHSTWQRLASVYVAPETGDLLAATAPVQSRSAAVGGRLEQVGAALVAYADEVRPIKAQLEGLRSSASRFVSSVQGEDDWRSDGDKVDEHNALLSGVSSAVAAWMEAQRRCANAINALDGGLQYVADNGDGTVQANEYGYTAGTLDAATASESGVPWGRPEEEDLPWYEDVGHAAMSFGKGVVVDGLWGAVKGIGTMVNPWSDGFGDAWVGLGKLGLALTPGVLLLNDLVALPGLEKGELSRTLTETGKGLVAWDTWKTDPARALGATLTNIVTAVVGTKGAGAALKGGTVAKDAGLAGRVASLPRLAEVRASVLAQLAKIPRIELPRLDPAFAGGGPAGRFHFDLERPDTGRMHSEAAPDAPGGSTRPPLPATTEASVARKLDTYLLDPHHPVGGTKAEWFRRALGFTQGNAADLARQLTFDESKAVTTGVTKYGQKFNQVISVTGANGRTLEVLVAWIRNEDGVVRLVTAVPKG